tara:strand:+ start:455 stop:757 length:303 start_codon:yes stop_codon:yes gene_type:complete
MQVEGVIYEVLALKHFNEDSSPQEVIYRQSKNEVQMKKLKRMLPPACQGALPSLAADIFDDNRDADELKEIEKRVKANLEVWLARTVKTSSRCVDLKTTV